MRIEDLGNHTIIKTGNLDANAEIHGGKYPFFTCSKESKQIDNYAFDGEFVVVAGNGDLNVKYYKGKFNAYQRTYAISPKETVNGKYLYYFLEKYLVKLRELSIGGVIKYIKIGNLTEAKIPLPPLPTQQKIASILDAADALRQKDKALLAKYDELTQSLFLDMFGDPVKNEKGWEEIKLGDICDVGSSKRVFVDELVEVGIPFFRGTEVGKLGEGKEITPTLFITKDHYQRLKEQRGIPKKGDLLMPSICPDGRIWAVDNDAEFYFKDGRVLWIEVNSKKINSIYLKYHLKGSFFANYHNIASGTTFAELKIVALKKMDVLYPDLKLQNQFAERVTIIEQQKAIAQASLEKSEELFNSLLQKAFKGELV